MENKNKFPNEGKTHNALLTGKLICAKCGKKMRISHGHINKQTGAVNYYYACSMKKSSKGSRCDNKNGKVSEIDSVVIQQLKQLALDKNKLLNNLISENKRAKSLNNSLAKDEIIKKSISEKEKQIDNLLNKLSIDEDISDLIIKKIKELKKEIQVLNDDLNQVLNSKAQIDEEELNLSFIELMLNRCSIIDTLEQDEIKQLIDVLIDSITWNGDSYELTINFIGSEVCEEAQVKKK